MTAMPDPHFQELQAKINARLVELDTEHAMTQIQDFPWLYGALGAVPAPIMFICENPSLTGVRKANVATLDGGPPDIEAQWCGGPSSVARTRFRHVLCELGLKTTQEEQKGGWACYITNVVKEANIATDQGDLSTRERQKQAERWASILAWEIEAVSPTHLFCVGGRAAAAVRWLQGRRLIPRFRVNQIWHYSAGGGNEAGRDHMRSGIQAVLGRRGSPFPTIQPPEATMPPVPRMEAEPRRRKLKMETSTTSSSHWIQDSWEQLPHNRGRKSKYLGPVKMRKHRWEDSNPRDPSKKGAGYYAFQVGVSGITTEEYVETLRELWRLRPELNQKEKTLQPWKHLNSDMVKKYVRLVEYNAPGVREARERNGLPPLDGPKPPDFDLVNQDIVDRIIGGKDKSSGFGSSIRF